MHRSLLLLVASAALALAGCGDDDQELADDLAAVTQGEGESEGEEAAPRVPVEATTELADAEGSDVGRAWFRDDDGRAMVEVQVAGLSSGFHPMYLYEVGTCDPDEATADDAALLALPPLLVLENGVGSMSTLAGSMTLDSLLADDGTALLIAPSVETLADLPSLPDDGSAAFATGSQVACGVIDG